MKLYRIIFPVTDIEKASQFYTYLFDQQGTRVSPGRHYYNLEGVVLAIYDPVADGDEINQHWAFHENQYIYIATDRLSVVHDRFIRSAEVKYVDDEISEMPWGEKLFYAKDPFNNPVCFVDAATVFTG